MLRQLLKGFAICVVLAIACLTYGFAIEPRLTVTRYDTIALKRPLETPLKIVLVSDLHIGGMHVPAYRVTSIVRRINIQKPDLIVIGGDFVHGEAPYASRPESYHTVLKDGLSRLEALEAPLGTYTVIGNHDNWYAPDRIRTDLDRVGIKILDNEHVVLGGICLVGLDDFETGQPDPNAFKQCPESLPLISLMHSPDGFGLLPDNTDLAMAGHTHGGQINLPFIGRAVTATHLGKPYAYGRGRFQNIPVWVTAGIGTSILPARFRATPEVVVLTVQ